jgi:hypothetical protein
MRSELGLPKPGQQESRLFQVLPKVKVEGMDSLQSSRLEVERIAGEQSGARSAVRPEIRYTNQLRKELEQWSGSAMLEGLQQISFELAVYFPPTGEVQSPKRECLSSEQCSTLIKF